VRLARATAARVWSRSLTLTHLVWTVPLVAIVVALRQPIKDNSYLWHIRAGDLQVESGSVLTDDPFSFTLPGAEWRTQSWLLELFYSWAEKIEPLFSADVVVAGCSALLSIAVGLRIARKRNGILAPLGLIWVVWISLGYFTPRPVVLSLALFSLVVLVCEDERLSWTLPIVFWLWASVHGGFIVGLGYVALSGLSNRRIRTTPLLASVIATLISAHGWGTWEILLRFSSSRESLDYIREWLTPDFLSIPLFPFAIGIVSLLIGAVHDRFTRRELWIIIPFLVFSFSANRAVPLAAIALVPFIVPAWTPRTIGKTQLPRSVSWITVGLILGVSLVVPVESGGLEARFPVEAALRLDPVPTFHDDLTGGYLIYVGFTPGVFLDDRAELYGDLYVESLQARHAKGAWMDLLDRYQVEQVVLPATDALLQLLDLRGWRRVYEDASFVVMREGS
jgi:hypothetical protein